MLDALLLPLLPLLLPLLPLLLPPPPMLLLLLLLLLPLPLPLPRVASMASQATSFCRSRSFSARSSCSSEVSADVDGPFAGE